MDYLDELDGSALAALVELGCKRSSSPLDTQKTVKFKRPVRRVPRTFLVRLRDLFSSAWELAEALRLERVPAIKIGQGEESDECFCLLQQVNVDALEAWVLANTPSTKLVKIPFGLAHKDTGQDLPLLGRDPTLPHHMPSSSQHEIIDISSTVPFFFYGTLANHAKLSSLFNKPEAELSPLLPATLRNGRLRTWGGKYRALVDAPGESIEGWCYAVASIEEEEALRRYETDQYEVVAASIMVDGKEVLGRTFRFAGCEEDLTSS